MHKKLADSINSTLHTIMQDDDVILIGEDIGKLGGVFRVTKGLQEKYGFSRVRDSLLSEATIIGQSIGLALSGKKIICEIQFEGFIYPAMNQIVTQLARMQDRWSGKLRLHIVVRVPVGGGFRGVEHHSDSNEALFSQIPGLTVAYPFNPIDASEILSTSINLGSPVIFFEPKKLYWRDLSSLATLSPIKGFKARSLKAGNDITIVSYGSIMPELLDISAELEGEFSIELIDLRWLYPLDIDTIISSVRKTGRLLVIHEAPKFLGIGAEIISEVCEVISDRQIRVGRLGAPRTVYPPADYEKDYLVQRDKILEKIRSYFYAIYHETS